MFVVTARVVTRAGGAARGDGRCWTRVGGAGCDFVRLPALVGGDIVGREPRWTRRGGGRVTRAGGAASQRVYTRFTRF